MLNADPTKRLYRIVAGIVGLTAIAAGIAPMLSRGDVFYSNWWGGLVFSPLAIVIGLFTVGCALFKPEWLAARRMESKGSKHWYR